MPPTIVSRGQSDGGLAAGAERSHSSVWAMISAAVARSLPMPCWLTVNFIRVRAGVPTPRRLLAERDLQAAKRLVHGLVHVLHRGAERPVGGAGQGVLRSGLDETARTAAHRGRFHRGRR